MAALALGLRMESGTAQVLLATGCCVVLGFLIYALYAVLFSMPGAMAVYRQVRRWVEGLVAGLFVLAGLGLIRSALARQ